MKNSSKILLFVVIVQTAAIIWLVIDKMQQTKTNEKLEANIVEITDNKDAVEQELKSMLTQYDELKTSNENINKQLEDEQAKIKNLIVQLKHVKRTDKAKIEQLEKETQTLRSIMRSYIKQIDSLNTKNQLLTAENLTIKEQYQTEVAEKETILSQRDSLNKEVKKAAILSAGNIVALALNNRGSETVRARKMQKIKTTFYLSENAVTKKGSKNIYIRIAGPDGKIIMSRESGMFTYQGREIAFSSQRNVNYQGKKQEVIIFWTAEEEQAIGNYIIDIFADGSNIGESILKLK